MYPHLPSGSAEMSLAGRPRRQSSIGFVPEYRLAARNFASNFREAICVAALTAFECAPAPRDIRFACFDLGLKLFPHLQAILKQVLQPFTQFFLFFWTKAQNRLLNLCHCAHEIMIIRRIAVVKNRADPLCRKTSSHPLSHFPLPNYFSPVLRRCSTYFRGKTRHAELHCVSSPRVSAPGFSARHNRRI